MAEKIGVQAVSELITSKAGREYFTFEDMTQKKHVCFIPQLKEHCKIGEIEADINALNPYLSLGYPYIEAIYTYTNILTNNTPHILRMNYIENFVKKYHVEHEGKKENESNYFSGMF